MILTLGPLVEEQRPKVIFIYLHQKLLTNCQVKLWEFIFRSTEESKRRKHPLLTHHEEEKDDPLHVLQENPGED